MPHSTKGDQDMQHYGNVHEATAAMFRDPTTWPGLILPIKKPSQNKAPNRNSSELAVMLESDGTTASVVFGITMYDMPDPAKIQKIAVAKLITDGWVVD